MNNTPINKKENKTQAEEVFGMVLEHIDPMLDNMNKIASFFDEMKKRKEYYEAKVNPKSLDSLKRKQRMKTLNLLIELKEELRHCDELGIEYDLLLGSLKKAGKYDDFGLLFKS